MNFETKFSFKTDTTHESLEENGVLSIHIYEIFVSLVIF